MTRLAKDPSRVRAQTLRVALALMALTLGARAAGPGLTETSKPAGLGTLPLCFEADGGQTGGSFPFLARGRACNFFVGPTEAVLVLTRQESSPSRAHREPGAVSSHPELASRELRFEFVGANCTAAVSGTEELPGKANYFLGQDPAGWRTSVPLFGRVRVGQIYPGVDLVYYGNEQRLEYDFVVAPQADPGRIAIHFTGADKIQVNAEGELVFTLGRETIRQPKPLVYQTVHGVRQPIAGSYTLTTPQTVAFKLGNYDPALPLVIDPVLSYSTFYGGNGLEVAWAVSVDTNGFVYVAGETTGGLPTSPSTVANRYHGSGPHKGDAFVAKFNNAATSLIYLSYIGGSADDVGLSLAVDDGGNAYLTGYTDSTDFPTRDPIYSHISGIPYTGLNLYPIDAFVTKLGPAGTNLLYSTYLGGASVDEGVGIAVDKTGAAYVTGYTESPSFPTLRTMTGWITSVVTSLRVVQTNGGFVTNSVAVTNYYGGTNYGGRGDAFLAKISPKGTNLVYSFYLGGNNLDVGSGVAVNAEGVAFVTGYTRSTDFPVVNAYQPRLAGGMDAFVTAIGPTGTNPVLSTYLGGSSDDAGFRIALDTNSNYFVTGLTTADFLGNPFFPITPSALNPGGVSRSDDRAVNWQNASHGLVSISVATLAIDPITPTRIYAGTPRGVARSIDGGASWSTDMGVSVPTNVVSPAIGIGSVNALAIDPATPTTLYAGVNSQGVFKSLDAGINWSLSSTDLLLSVLALAVDPVTPTTIYAGTLGGGVMKSTNSAANWTAINNGLGGELFADDLVLDPTNPNTIYAATDLGVYRTTNSGAAWYAASTGLSNSSAYGLVIDPQSPATLYLNTTFEIFKTTNSAATWRPISEALNLNKTNEWINCLAIDPLTPSTLYAGTRKGVFKSSDAGVSWGLYTNGLATLSVRALAVNPQSPATLIAGLSGLSSFGGEDVFLFKSGSSGYSAVFGGTNKDEGWDVAVDVAGHAHIVGVTYSTNFPVQNVSGLFNATNAGGADAFVAELSSDGGNLVQAAYLGGSDADLAYGIALDLGGNSYFVGETSSRSFPTLAAYQSTFGGSRDAFLAKVLSDTPPTLQIATTGSEVTLSWPLFWPEFFVQTTTNLADTNAWSLLTTAPFQTNGTLNLQLGTTNAASYFRLRR